MKPLLSILLVALLAHPAFADDPAPKPEPPRGPDWQNWGAASAAATKHDGYVMMFITPAPKDGKEAPYSTRMLNELGNPALYDVLNSQFGCWKGNQAAAGQVAGKAIAGVAGAEAPSIVFVDPSSGELIDCVPGHASCGELKAVLKAIEEGNHLGGLRVKMKIRANQSDAKLQLAFGEALVRAGDSKAAREALAVAEKSSDQKEQLFAKLALLRCDMLESKFDDAIKHAAALIPLIPPQGNEQKAEAIYLQMWAYFRLGDLDNCSKAALDLRENFRRATFGVKSTTDVEDYGFDFIRKEKVPSAK